MIPVVLVPISLIFMSGRGLEPNHSNVDMSATECPILFKFVLMTSVESGVHTMLAVHDCILLNFHKGRG